MDSDYFLLQKQGNNKQNKRKRGINKQKDIGERTHIQGEYVYACARWMYLRICNRIC